MTDKVLYLMRIKKDNRVEMKRITEHSNDDVVSVLNAVNHAASTLSSQVCMIQLYHEAILPLTHSLYRHVLSVVSLTRIIMGSPVLFVTINIVFISLTEVQLRRTHF